MSQALFAHYCKKEGLIVVKSRVIDWELPGSDCLTLFRQGQAPKTVQNEWNSAAPELAHEEKTARVISLDIFNALDLPASRKIVLPPPIEPAPLNQTVSSPEDATSPANSVSAVRQFYVDAADRFADVVPPQLSEIHLRNSRVLPSRDHILPLMPTGGICAEIGTQTGDFAKLIISVMQPVKLHIYDIDYTAFDYAHFTPAMERGTVELHQGDSSTLLANVPDRHFDFIYIDGDHSYEGIVKDLEQAARKIKHEGWIVCNDYTIYSPLEEMQYGVYRAVNEFCIAQGFEIVYLGLHPWSYHDVALRRQA
jgi:precorrin-6B methylase 2